jgi:hypothetical protein
MWLNTTTKEEKQPYSANSSKKDLGNRKQPKVVSEAHPLVSLRIFDDDATPCIDQDGMGYDAWLLLGELYPKSKYCPKSFLIYPKSSEQKLKV